MTEVGVHEAKSTLSELLRRVATGEEVIITRDGAPVARLVPIELPERRSFGADRGRFEIPADFEGPLPDDLQRLFDG
jgi:prevent-host-death family protein